MDLVQYLDPVVLPASVLPLETLHDLSTNPVLRRAQYTLALVRRYDATDWDDPNYPAIEHEWQAWQLRYQAELLSYGLIAGHHRTTLLKSVQSGHNPQGDTMEDIHWLWTGRPSPGHTEPRINIWGERNVPVYRVLWPYCRPREELLPGKRPKHNPYQCTYDALADQPCVNPFHFWFPQRNLARMPIALRDGRRPTLSNLHKEQGLWETNDAGIRVCKDYGHPLGEAMQQRLDLRKQVYCPGCHVMRKAGLARGANTGYEEPSPEAIRMADEIMRALREHHQNSEGSPGE